MMKIALLSWESLHSVAVGGVAAHVSELAQALALQGHEAHVFTRPGSRQLSDEWIGGVHYHRCLSPWSPDFLWETDAMCRAFAARLAEVERENGFFDIVHAHDWLTANALAWSKNGHYRKYAFTFHSTEFGRCGNRLHDGPSRAIRDREWHGAYCADRVFSVSHHLKDEVRWLYQVPDGKMRVVFNGVDAKRFDMPVDMGYVKERYSLGRMDPTVLFCGRMTWQKGPDILLEAIPPLLGFYPHAKFLFVGDGDMRWGLEERARALRIEHATRFLGYRSGRELIELLKACDVVCVPSRNEPFGIIILEAWSAGKPVVATNHGGPGEIIRHETDGLIVYDNPESVGWGLGTLFTDFERARWMGQNGRERAQREFDWNAIGHQVVEVYAS